MIRWITARQKNTEKIDGATALIIVLDSAIRDENKSSIYDERGSLILY